MMEDWHKNEWFWNNYLNQNKSTWKIASVGQIESWIKLMNGEYHFFEIKTQEPFEPPPFYGHGLPRWQVEKYTQMQIDLGVIWHLVVFDTVTNHGYQQLLSVLNDNDFHDTHGKKPRRIYPVSAFDVWINDWTTK